MPTYTRSVSPKHEEIVVGFLREVLALLKAFQEFSHFGFFLRSVKHRPSEQEVNRFHLLKKISATCRRLIGVRSTNTIYEKWNIFGPNLDDIFELSNLQGPKEQIHSTEIIYPFTEIIECGIIKWFCLRGCEFGTIDNAMRKEMLSNHISPPSPVLSISFHLHVCLHPNVCSCLSDAFVSWNSSLSRTLAITLTHI